MITISNQIDKNHNFLSRLFSSLRFENHLNEIKWKIIQKQKQSSTKN